MFIGEFQHTLDSKGRVIIPSRLREGLGERFVLTRGIEPCVAVYPLDEWNRTEAKLINNPMTKKDLRALNRIMFSGAMEVELDKQSRALIPQYLREHSGIDKNVMILGVGDRVEIWNEDTWRKYYDHVSDNLSEMLENLDLPHGR